MQQSACEANGMRRKWRESLKENAVVAIGTEGKVTNYANDHIPAFFLKYFASITPSQTLEAVKMK